MYVLVKESHSNVMYQQLIDFDSFQFEHLVKLL